MGLNFSKMLGLSTPASSFRKNQATAADGMGASLPAYQKVATSAGAEYGRTAPMRGQAGTRLYDRYAAGFDAGGLMKKNTLANIGTQFEGAAARTRANAAATGQSPMAALSLLDARKAQATSKALTDAAMLKQQEDERYLQGAFRTAGDMAGTALSEQNNALGNMNSVYNQQFGAFNNLAQADEARRAADAQLLGNFIGQGAGLIGGMARLPSMSQMSGGRGVGGGEFSSVPDVGVSTAPGGGLTLAQLRRFLQSNSGNMMAGGY